MEHCEHSAYTAARNMSVLMLFICMCAVGRGAWAADADDADRRVCWSGALRVWRLLHRVTY